MAATPTRAVRLIPIGEYVELATLGTEQAAAYTTIEKAAAIVRLVDRGATRLTYSRNAATEAAARKYAAATFR